MRMDSLTTLPSLPITAYNNTAYNNGGPDTSGEYPLNFHQPGVASVLRNNLSFQPNSAFTHASVIHDHNSWDASPAVTVSTADFLTTSFTANTGPRQSDGSLPASNFLRLASGSDLIDKGTNVGLAFSGSAPDLGVYEFTPAATPTPTPSPTPGAGCSATYTSLNVASASSNGGFAWILARSFGTPADNGSFPNRSILRLFENGTEIGPAHAAHADIRNLGAGRFSHWSSTDGTGESLYFSASNNTDPRSNGKPDTLLHRKRHTRHHSSLSPD